MLRRLAGALFVVTALLGVAAASAPASAMPMVDRSPAQAASIPVQDGVEQVRLVCGPYGCMHRGWHHHYRGWYRPYPRWHRWGYYHRPYWHHRHHWYRPVYYPYYGHPHRHWGYAHGPWGHAYYGHRHHRHHWVRYGY